MINLPKICKELIIKEPYYGLFLLNLRKEFTPEIPTLGVTLDELNTVLSINEEFLESKTLPEQVALLKHELMHICLGHLNLRKYFSDHNLFNIAADLEINQYIENLPDGALTFDAFPQYVFPKFAGTKAYYDILKDKYENDEGCNSEGEKVNKEELDKIGQDLHKTWKSFDKLTTEEEELIQNQIDHMTKETATQVVKNSGSIPGELKSYIDSLLKINPPVFNWKAYFRRILGNSLDVTVKRTKRKESKRFLGARGQKIKFKQSIIVAIDTSGSVSDEDFKDFFSEIHHIYKCGGSIDILEFDYSIQRIYPYKGKWDGSISGRGGTDFKEIIDYFNDNRSKYSAFVVFTDGYALKSHLKPKTKVIWMVTNSGDKNEKYPGHPIFIPQKNNK